MESNMTNPEHLNDSFDDETNEFDYHDDSMDGDHDSAMTSIGWGTDDDYGYFENECWD